MTTKVEKFELQVEAIALHFQSPLNENHRYVVFPNGRMDFIEFEKKYRKTWPPECTQATPVEIGNWDKYFMVYVSDCFDPPIAIVSARNESDAEEAFYEELGWADVEEPDLKDYNQEELAYSSRDGGKNVDTSNICVREVKLVHVEL